MVKRFPSTVIFYPYLFTVYLRLENQTSALVFLKFSGNARTTNLRPVVCLFVYFFFFGCFIASYRYSLHLALQNKSAVEKFREEIVWVCPGV